jgi:hypothetical protein
MSDIVVFMCPHGAGKSRIAAAWFNAASPAGWTATTAGVEPQEVVSVHAPRLLAGTGAAQHLDEEPPRPLASVPERSLVVAIDCPESPAPGARHWTLTDGRFDAAMAEELRHRAEALAVELGARRR